MSKDETKTSNTARRKMGKTLLVSTQRDSDTTIDSKYFTVEKCEGLEKVTEKDGKYFLLFSDYTTAKNSLFHLRKEFNYFVKFVHYKVFFKCKQLGDVTPSDDFEHGEFKNVMRSLVQTKTNAHVLYAPRLFRIKDRDDGDNWKYTTSGYITIDTKEGEEALLDKDQLKFSKLGDDKYEVAFYRYRVRRDEEGAAAKEEL